MRRRLIPAGGGVYLPSFKIERLVIFNNCDAYQGDDNYGPVQFEDSRFRYLYMWENYTSHVGYTPPTFCFKYKYFTSFHEYECISNDQFYIDTRMWISFFMSDTTNAGGGAGIITTTQSINLTPDDIIKGYYNQYDATEGDSTRLLSYDGNLYKAQYYTISIDEQYKTVYLNFLNEQISN